MKNILITGFEPFGGEKINPSYEALKLLPETIATAKIHILCLPVVFGKNGAMWKRSMMIRAFGNNALMNLMYWAFRSTTTDFTAALSRFV